jgi:hypothetical protein
MVPGDTASTVHTGTRYSSSVVSMPPSRCCSNAETAIRHCVISNRSLVFRLVSGMSQLDNRAFVAQLILYQLKELQLALDNHPRRNRLTALQISLQNLFDLLKYAVTLAAASPRQFKWTALVSWLAVMSGACSYAVYLRSVRGHLLHLEWFRKAS